MISDALRTGIEKWVSKKGQNPVFQLAQAGRLTPAMVTRYIANVTYMVRLTPMYLRSARDRAREVGNLALAAFYEHKLEEEDGHVAWGESDLESLTQLVALPSSPSATPAIEALADDLVDMIAQDPSLYLCYLAFTEYITVLIGPELLTLIEERCGVPRSSMTVIDNHIELDRDHAEEGFGIIDDLVGDPRKLAPMRRALSAICARFDDFCRQVTTESNDERVRHVSAA